MGGDPPLVSIVTPSLNQGRFLGDAIRSVLDQDYAPLEYLVVDGGSTDASLDVLRSYEGRITWHSAADEGQAAAIARGFAETRGEILAWLNADDVYEKGAVARAVAFMRERTDVALAYGDAVFVDHDGRTLGRCEHVEPFDRDRLLNHKLIVAQPSAFFRRDAFEAVGGLDKSLRWTLDYDLWLRLSERFVAAHIEAVLARVRIHPGSKTSTGGLQRLLEVEDVVRRHGRRRLPRSFYREMWAARRQALAASWRAGRYGAALRHGRLGADYWAAWAIDRLYARSFRA